MNFYKRFITLDLSNLDETEWTGDHSLQNKKWNKMKGIHFNKS
jgi:hypothetical protein